MVKKLVLVFAVLFFALQFVNASAQPIGLKIATAQTMTEVALDWDHSDPQDVAYYVIYVSTTKGQFGQPYARVTNLPGNNAPFRIRFPADGVTRYMVVTAFGTNGLESANSNQIEFTPDCQWQDLGP